MGEVADRYKSIIETVINKYLKDGSNYSDTKLNYARAVAESVYGIIEGISGISSEILDKLKNCRDKGENCDDYEDAYDSTIIPLLKGVVRSVLYELIDDLIIEDPLILPSAPASESYFGKILVSRSSIIGDYSTDIYICVKERSNGEDVYRWKKLTP